MKSLDTYNNLKGRTLDIKQVNQLIDQAKKDGVHEVIFRLERMLFQNSNQAQFTFTSVTKVDLVPSDLLNGLDQIQEDLEEDGLGKAISPDQIYDMVTKKVLDAISSGKELPWRKPWGSIVKYGMLATNFDSKNAYRGINAVLLNALEEFDNPYFLTFNQIKKHKGKLKKGSTGREVVYFTILYKYDQDNADGKLSFGTYDLKKFKSWINANKSKISIFKNNGSKYLSSFINNATRPILKYYKVFSADDVEGIDWKLKKLAPKKANEKIETAEAIVQAMPKKPKITPKENGNEAYYKPSTDSITVPAIANFENSERYYGVLFHELVHSTGSEKRIGRPLTGKFGSPSYAFEELIAELGATFLNAESGTLYYTFENSASYLKGWIQSLTAEMKKDNKFFFRASSKAQAAADFILDRNAKGIPAYHKKIKTSKPKIAARTNKPSLKSTKKKINNKTGQMALFGFSFQEYSWSNHDNYKLKYQVILDRFLKAYRTKINLFEKEIGFEPIYQEDIEEKFPLSDINQQNALLFYFLERRYKKEYTASESAKLKGEISYVQRVKKLTPEEFQKELETGKIAQAPKPKAKPVNTKPKISDQALKKDLENDIKKLESKGKTKKSIGKRLKEKLGLGFVENDPLFTIASDKKEKDAVERFQLKGVLGEYLGMIQRFRLLILLKGDTHAGKSEMVMQLANAFIETGFTIAYFDLEQGGMESADTREAMDRNIPIKNRDKLAMAGTAPNGIETIFEYAEMADVMIIDSFQKLNVPNTRMDELRIKFPHTMFITIFQQNAEGGTRGGVSADFDTPIILKVHKVGDVAFVNNYAEILKNRGNSETISSKYSMYKKQILKP
ncbi:MAG: antirestriction protein ArdC [Crocinitomix sp.]|jgi:antirestriction protein ArdC